jgi:hypothetical protein
MCGRLVSQSKSHYLDSNPDNIVVFNANVCITKSGLFRRRKTDKIWYGDLDVTKDMRKIEALAEAIGERVYVLREMDARFENEDSPKLENAVFTSIDVW